MLPVANRCNDSVHPGGCTDDLGERLTSSTIRAVRGSRVTTSPAAFGLPFGVESTAGAAGRVARTEAMQ
jgi:hypothetical protein